MKAKELIDNGDYSSHPYMEECTCGNFIRVFTQVDYYPEYYTNVYIECPECKELVLFKLPVN